MRHTGIEQCDDPPRAAARGAVVGFTLPRVSGTAYSKPRFVNFEPLWCELPWGCTPPSPRPQPPNGCMGSSYTSSDGIELSATLCATDSASASFHTDIRSAPF